MGDSHRCAMKLAARKEAEIKRQHWGEGMPVGTIACQRGSPSHHGPASTARVGRGRIHGAGHGPPSPIKFEDFARSTRKIPHGIRASRLWEMAKGSWLSAGPDHFRRIVLSASSSEGRRSLFRLKTLSRRARASGSGALSRTLVIGKAQRPLWAFVMVLSYSRALYCASFGQCDAAVSGWSSWSL